MSNPIRDTLLRSAGRPQRQKCTDPPRTPRRRTSVRRTVYARVSRGRLSNLLKVYDFSRPGADQRRPRPDDDCAAAALHHEQPVHGAPKRKHWQPRWKPDPDDKGAGNAASIDACLSARSQSERKSTWRLAIWHRGTIRAIRASAALQQRGDFSGNDRKNIRVAG